MDNILTSMTTYDRLEKRKTRVSSSGYFYIIVVGALQTIGTIKVIINVYHSSKDLQLLQQKRRFFHV